VLSGKGGAATAAVLTVVVRDTKVDKAILIGVAGGFSRQKVARGDVVVAKTVLDYDFGKLVPGKYIRRPERDWQCDPGLVSHAMLATHKPWFDRIKVRRPDGMPASKSKVHDGYVASGDKVIDDSEHPFFRQATTGVEEIHAVEMESAGAGTAVQFLQSMGVLRFLMIKGVSDQPDAGPGANRGTAERAKWKRYAAAAAAALARGLMEEMAPDEISRLPTPDRADHQRRAHGEHDAFEIAGLYRRFDTDWRPALFSQHERKISVVEALDWLLRSLIPWFERRPSLIKELELRAWNVQLPQSLPEEQEVAIRELRNLGLLSHDGPYLFTPTRSKKVELTSAGRLLNALYEGVDSSKWQEIASAIVRELSKVLRDTNAIHVLKAVEQGEKVSVGERDVVRKLRNLHLVAHEEEFLPSAERLRITGLGHYLLQCAIP
jgi:nucleoside phosphorylase